MSLRIVIVDDHDVVRRGLRDLLDAEDDLEVIGEAASLAEARYIVPACNADVAVVDVRLPDGNGVELCRELRSSDPSLACLMLTSFDDDEALLSAVIAGASGYLVKQVKGIDIAGSVREVGKGHSLLNSSVKKRVIDRLREGTVDDSTAAVLNLQGDRILDMLVEGKTDRQIGSELNLTQKTVESYVSNLLNTAGVSRRTKSALPSQGR